MASCAASPPAARFTDPRRFCSRSVGPFRPWNPFWGRGFPTSKQRRRLCLFSLPPERRPMGGARSSWSDRGSSDNAFGGWLVAQPEPEKRREPFNYFSRVRSVGVGGSVAVLLAALVHFSFLRKGSNLQFNMLLHAFHGLVSPLVSGNKSCCEDSQISEQTLEDKSVMHDALMPTMNNDKPVSGEKKCIIPVAADSTQLKALFVLKRLKIIEDDVNSDELCTRREYARWLVKANSLLERNPKHKIVLSVVSGSSTIAAFDDVNLDDPDFWCIQALGEVGIAPCKLFGVKSNGSEESGSVNCSKNYFEPESSLSRLDLVDWRAQLEYLVVPGREEKSRC